MDTKQPEALRLAPCPFCGGGARRTTVGTNAWFGTGCDGDQSCPAHLRALTHKTQAEADAAWNRRTPPAAAELLRLRAENDAARLEIKSLQTRIQELGQQARECSDRKVVKLDARIKELEAQLDAVGAGGVEPLRKRECLHQICETAAPASDGEYPKLPERAAFEDWIKKDGGDLRIFGSGQNTHYCNSAVNNAWGGWKASAARVATTASAPVVLPEPDVFAKVSHKGAAKWDVEFTWPVGKFEEDGGHKLYTEQQVRAMLAAAPKPPAPSGPALEPVDKSPNLQGQAVDKSPETQGCGPAREPLTPEQLVTCMQLAGFTTWDSRMWELKRQVEAALGITAAQKGCNP